MLGQIKFSKILYCINHTKVKTKDNLRSGFSISLWNGKGDFYISDKYPEPISEMLKKINIRTTPTAYLDSSKLISQTFVDTPPVPPPHLTLTPFPSHEPSNLRRRKGGENQEPIYMSELKHNQRITCSFNFYVHCFSQTFHFNVQRIKTCIIVVYLEII